MKVLIFDTTDAAVQAVADRLLGEIRMNPGVVLGLATGGTVEPVYERMVNSFESGEISFAGVRTFNLDEYVGLSGDHPMSYHTYMNRHLFSRTDFAAYNVNIPRGDVPDPTAEAGWYEAEISRHGGVDCQLLGIGENGHIGFNEPTSSLSSVTRIKTLAPETVSANSRFFDRVEDVPTTSITAGIATILRSRKVALLATGEKKSHAVAKMIEGPLSAICPASALQLHPLTEIYLDVAAASELTLHDYYQAVHPNGRTDVP